MPQGWSPFLINFGSTKIPVMSKISKALKAVSRIIQKPWLLNKVLEEEEPWKRYVEEKFNLAQGFPVVRPEVIFGDFSETVSPFSCLDGGSNPIDLALLKKLARTIPHCNYFEIGTWRGESVANVAQVADECVTINLSREEMENMHLGEQYIDQHRLFSNELSNVKHIEGNTQTFDFSSLNQKFDLIFIDGDHRFDMVKNDTRKVFEHLVHDKSIVVWHDYSRNQECIRYEVLAGILEGCPERFQRNIRHVAHTICAVYFPEVIPGAGKETLTVPEGFFTIRFDYTKKEG